MPSLADRILGTLAPEYRQLRADVDALQAQIGAVMATQDLFNERMNLIDEATDEIANDLQALRDELSKGEAISDENLAALDAKIERLRVLGSDPDNPVPPVEG